jgi:hypothetical protein
VVQRLVGHCHSRARHESPPRRQWAWQQRASERQCVCSAFELHWLVQCDAVRTSCLLCRRQCLCAGDVGALACADFVADARANACTVASTNTCATNTSTNSTANTGANTCATDTSTTNTSTNSVANTGTDTRATNAIAYTCTDACADTSTNTCTTTANVATVGNLAVDNDEHDSADNSSSNDVVIRSMRSVVGGEQLHHLYYNERSVSLVYIVAKRCRNVYLGYECITVWW